MAAVGARHLIDLVGVSYPVQVQKALLDQAVVPDRVELGCQKDSQQAADVHVGNLVGLREGHHLAPPRMEAARGFRAPERVTEQLWLVGYHPKCLAVIAQDSDSASAGKPTNRRVQASNDDLLKTAHSGRAWRTVSHPMRTDTHA